MTTPDACGDELNDDQTPFIPRTFALVVDASLGWMDVVGYGMTMPDGSALVTGTTSLLARCSAAQSAARMFDADLVWTGQPACPKCGHRTAPTADE